MIDIHNEEALREQRELDRQQQVIQAAIDFIAVAELPAGRRFFRRLMAECGAYHSSFTGEPLTSAFNEGKRAISLWILEQFSARPDLYMTLLIETDDGIRNDDR